MNRLLVWLPLLVLLLIEFLTGVGLLLSGMSFISLLSLQECVLSCANILRRRSPECVTPWRKRFWGHALAVLSSGITQMKSHLLGANR